MKAQERGKPSFSGVVVSATGGYLLSGLSALIYSLVTVLVKDMKNIHPAQLVVYRYCAVLLFNLPSMVLSGKNVFGPPGCRLAIFIRSVLVGMAILFQFFAFRFLPLGEASVLAFSYPAFVTIGAKIFLKESFGILQVISLLITIIGVIFTTGLLETIIWNSRTYTKESVYGLAAALASVIFITANFVLLRRLKNVEFSALLFNSSVVAVFQGIIFTEVGGGFHLHYKGLQQVYIILIGLLSYLGQLVITLATQWAEVGPVTTIRASTDILFSFLWQVVIFGVIPSGIKITGAVFIIASTVLVGFRDRLNPLLPEKCVNLW